MSELKTKPNHGDVESFIASVEPEQKRDDSRALLKLMQEITGEEPVLWGPSIIGFGNYHYVYESGREGDWFLTGFSPRKQALTIYLMGSHGFDNSLMDKLGKHKTGKGCLYVKKLDDVDEKVLKELIEKSIEALKKLYADYN